MVDHGSVSILVCQPLSSGGGSDPCHSSVTQPGGVMVLVTFQEFLSHVLDFGKGVEIPSFSLK